MRNDVYNNRYHVPVISSPNPANEAMMRDSVNIYVMINNEFIGHVGLVIGNGEDALLYDPAGSYTGCKNNQCEDGSYTLRGQVISFNILISIGMITFLTSYGMVMISLL